MLDTDISVEIDGAVGERGPNAAHNVMAVQIVLNHFIRNNWMGTSKKLKVDGICGPNTRGRIVDFQTHYVPVEAPYRTITPGGPTIQFFNRHHYSALIGMKPPKPRPHIPAKPKPIEEPRPTPPNLVRTLWPRARPSGKFAKSTGIAAPTPPFVATKFGLENYEMDKTIEVKSMAFKLSFGGEVELKAPKRKSSVAAGHADHWIDKIAEGSGRGRVVEWCGDGKKLGDKISAKLSEKIGVELASSWTVNDFKKFEDKAIAGDIKSLGGEMAALKVNFSVFKWLEVETAFTPTFPCPFAVQGKFIIPADDLLGFLGAPLSVQQEVKECKAEISGTVHIGLSKAAWLKVGQRVGKETIEKLFETAGKKVAEAFIRYGNFIGIAMFAVDIAQYERALFEYWKRKFTAEGELWGKQIEYANGYTMALGLRESRMMNLTDKAGLSARNAGVHDANLAATRWGRNAVATVMVQRFANNPSEIHDPIKWYFDSTNNVQEVKENFVRWIDKNPTLISSQLRH